MSRVTDLDISLSLLALIHKQSSLYSENCNDRNRTFRYSSKLSRFGFFCSFSNPSSLKLDLFPCFPVSPSFTSSHKFSLNQMVRDVRLKERPKVDLTPNLHTCINYVSKVALS